MGGWVGWWGDGWVGGEMPEVRAERLVDERD